MKKSLLFLIAIIFSLGQAIADSTSNDPIIFVRKERQIPGTPHRAPLRINIEAFYNAETNSLSIVYEGEDEGEVYLYLGDDLVGYSNEINTTFLLPSAQGLYTIEIVAESWTAEAELEL